jgi:hypothetical protein
MVLNILTPCFVAFVNPFHALRLFNRWRIRKSGKYGTRTQQETNAIFEGGPFDLPKAFAMIHTNIFTAFWFYPIFPFGVVWGFLSILAAYLTHKYLLLRRYGRPAMYSSMLAEYCYKLTKPCMVILGIASIMWDDILYEKIHWTSWTILAFTILWYLIPTHSIMRGFIDTDAKEAKIKKDVTYENVRYHFSSEYDRANPLTAPQANIAYINHCRNMREASQVFTKS